MATGEFAAGERDRDDFPLACANLDATADQTRVERVVVGVETQLGVGQHTRDPAAVDVGSRRRQRSHQLALLSQPVDRTATQCLVRARVRALKPAVGLVLVVELVREQAPGSKLFSK